MNEEKDDRKKDCKAKDQANGLPGQTCPPEKKQSEQAWKEGSQPAARPSKNNHSGSQAEGQLSQWMQAMQGACPWLVEGRASWHGIELIL
jgi:hypothetical protein